jgi:2,5-dioxopentanoate dehydrogenase
MKLEGKHLIAGERVRSAEPSFFGVNAATGENLEPGYAEASAKEIDSALSLAAAAFDEYRKTPAAKIAALLDAIADGIEALGQPLIDRAKLETGLPEARLTGERARTVNQTRLFATLVREGSWVDARIDVGDPKRVPLAKPDVRSMLVPIGPVVVFGASNFPLAISVAGTDTISALAAGCPVVVKGHPAHPGTSELLGNVIAEAISKAGLPRGVFSLVHGAKPEVGKALVNHAAARAVAFTGSFGAGRALFDEAARRPEPIPVYAEMGSTNPVFILPRALAERGTEIAKGYVQSVALGAGQFCTNPGLVFGLEAPALGEFTAEAGRAAGGVAAQTMLHRGILKSFSTGVARIADTPGVTTLAGGKPAENANAAGCVLFSTSFDTFRTRPELADEVFGPSSIVVSCSKPEDLVSVARGLHGHLTATVHGTPEDLTEHAELLHVLGDKVGRLIINGFPTGIEVCHAMHHGGPYPSTTDSHFTSIGTGAIYRFARPLCFQGFPEALLPEALRTENSLGIWRLVNGTRVR